MAGLRLLDRAALDALTPPEWLVEDVIPAGSFGYVWGAPGSYKSFLAIDWAMSVASGRSWLGHDVRQGPVIYVAGEGVTGMKFRAQAWESLRRTGLVDGFHVLNGSVDVADPECINEMIRMVLETGASLLVLDTWARVTPGSDENGNTAWGVAIKNLDVLREVTGVTVLVVHHARKDGRASRGGSVLECAADFIYRLDRDGSLAADLICPKQKDAEELRPTRLGLTLVRLDENGTTSLSVGEMLTGPRDLVARGVLLGVLPEPPDGLTSREVAARAHKRHSDVLHTLEGMAEEGALQVLNDGPAKLYSRVSG
jgi:hypothetical protein